jgi:pyruvate/2-oxoglutarate dehydrogenase complex dihydrolipoamide acyltransferase (E2) component
MTDQENIYRTESIPRMRRFSLDAGYLGRKRHIIHGLLEIDVTDLRAKLSSYKANHGEALSFSAYVIYCLGQAIQQHPHLHAYRSWRSQLVIFDDIHISAMIEVQKGGRKYPSPHIFKAVNRRSYLDIHHELRRAQTNPQRTQEAAFMGWFLYLPAPLRRLFYWLVMRFPHLFREYSSSVMVTAVGMFGRHGGWGIPAPNFTLTVTIGGIARKPGIVEDRIEIREFLDLTISVDHDIVDGAPMARFANTFQELLEDAEGFPG